MAIRSDSAGLEKSFLLDMFASKVGHVLEIGCGDGRLTRQYAELARQVVGIDLTSTGEMADLPMLADSVSAAAASAIVLPFRAARFDHVIFAWSF